MHHQFESLTEENEFIILNNLVFNTQQIKSNIIQDFQIKKSNLNFCCKNKFIRRYFRQVNQQGIFNLSEWKFWLKEDIQCELISFEEKRQIEQLQIRVILDYSSTKKDNHKNDYLNLQVFLYFSLPELEIEREPKIDDIEQLSLKEIYEQNTTYLYPFNSETICI